ncbi:MAG: hypothetical protein MI975_08475 [Cytophagales bacterium]|nr:hypothetical protein [Cytophagales bacterium]
MNPNKKRQLLERFYDLISRKRSEGYKMKSISQILSISPSVLSGLYKTVIPRILNNEQITDGTIKEGFSMVNNISVAKTFSEISSWIGILEKLKNEIERTEIQAWIKDYFDNIVNSGSDLATSGIIGNYWCYTMSSHKMVMKKEPFKFSYNDFHKVLSVKKGNEKSRVSYDGFATFTNSINLGIHLFDHFTRHSETQFISIIWPFQQVPDFLRGLFLALDYNRQPIARRIILLKTEEFSNQDYNQVPTTYYTKEEADQQKLSSYFEYLVNKEDALRCISIPAPNYNISDLKIEKTLLKTWPILND